MALVRPKNSSVARIALDLFFVMTAGGGGICNFLLINKLFVSLVN